VQLPLSPQVFAILSALVAEHAGLHFGVEHMSVFADKIGGRAVEAGFESLLDYYYFLRYDPGGPAELDALLESLVVNETYLFRELRALETMVTEFILPAVTERRRPRIWCAASSTGEEPHTVAMLLAAHGILEEVDLIASDVSLQALERARSGGFSRRAVRQEIPSFAKQWLDVTERGVAVSPRLTKAIGWRRINLMDDATIASLGLFDVVLCRNVLIYFSDATTRRIIDRLSGVLRPNGALFVGVSESLLRFGSSLICEEKNGVFLYKKPS
jgi:chemotaxis protein methyltransferase CheR